MRTKVLSGIVLGLLLGASLQAMSWTCKEAYRPGYEHYTSAEINWSPTSKTCRFKIYRHFPKDGSSYLFIDTIGCQLLDQYKNPAFKTKHFKQFTRKYGHEVVTAGAVVSIYPERDKGKKPGLSTGFFHYIETSDYLGANFSRPFTCQKTGK